MFSFTRLIEQESKATLRRWMGYFEVLSAQEKEVLLALATNPSAEARQLAKAAGRYEYANFLYNLAKSVLESQKGQDATDDE